MYKLEFPNISHKSAYLDIMAEWKSFEKTPTSPDLIFYGENFEEFLEIIENDRTGNNEWVPATLFFLMDDLRILGAIQIRHHIEQPNLKEHGGHIGYGIRPSERRKGYAKEILRLGLIETKNLGIKRGIAWMLCG